MLWAGAGIILDVGNKTVHGYASVSGAVPGRRFTVPTGWGRQYMKVFILMESGGCEYTPLFHKPRFIADRKSVSGIKSSAGGAQGIIVVTADIGKMPASCLQ